MKIPLVDLKAQYQAHRGPLDAALASVIEETAFVRGRFVKAFEEDYARAYGVKHCVSCGNGTDAIYIVLKMLGIGPGDEVITTANSWIATSETITQTGARVVFVDTEPDYFCLDPAKVEAAITPRTRAVIPVHLMGQPADMGRIVELCTRKGLALLEDCAQAHFATVGEKRVGTFGVAGTFSFYPGKNLGAYGDAGAIVTNDDVLARKCRLFANHGMIKKHEHEIEGINSRMDGLQAAILSAKLPHIHDWTAARRRVADRYDALLGAVAQVSVPRRRPQSEHVFHVYCIRAERRDDLAAFLGRNGIETTVHYPTPLPFLEAYRRFGHSPVDFSVAARHQQEFLSLPIYPEMTEAQIAHVADTIQAFYR